MAADRLFKAVMAGGVHGCAMDVDGKGYRLPLKGALPLADHAVLRQKRNDLPVVTERGGKIESVKPLDLGS